MKITNILMSLGVSVFRCSEHKIPSPPHTQFKDISSFRCAFYFSKTVKKFFSSFYYSHFQVWCFRVFTSLFLFFHSSRLVFIFCQPPYLLWFGVYLYFSDLGPFLPEVGVIQRNVCSVTWWDETGLRNEKQKAGGKNIKTQNDVYLVLTQAGLRSNVWS